MLDRALGNAEYPFIAIAPWSTVARSGRVLSMGQIELNCTYAKLNCLK